MARPGDVGTFRSCVFNHFVTLLLFFFLPYSPKRYEATGSSGKTVECQNIAFVEKFFCKKKYFEYDAVILTFMLVNRVNGAKNQ